MNIGTGRKCHNSGIDVLKRKPNIYNPQISEKDLKKTKKQKHTHTLITVNKMLNAHEDSGTNW